MSVAVTAEFHRARRSWILLAAFAATTGIAGTAGAQTSGLARPWTLTLGLQEGYETNPRYTGGHEGGSFVTRLNAALGRRFPGRRRSFAIDLDGGTALYGSSTAGSQLNWGVGARGTTRPFRKATLDLGLRSAEGYWRDAVATEGGLPPYTRTRTDGAAASFRYRLGGSLEGRLEARGDRYRFPSGGFEEGSSVLGRGALSRALGQDAKAGVTAEWERTQTYGQEFGIVRLLANGQRRVGRVLLSADGGLSSYRTRGAATPTETAPTGTVSAAGRWGRHTFVALAGRRVGQQYGLGAVGVSRSFSLGYGFTLSRRLGFTTSASADQFLSGTYGGSRPPDTQYVAAGLSCRLTRRLNAQAAYAFWRAGGSGSQSESHTISAGVSRAFSWR
jgi:hypothetical protein